MRSACIQSGCFEQSPTEREEELQLEYNSNYFIFNNEHILKRFKKQQKNWMIDDLIFFHAYIYLRKIMSKITSFDNLLNPLKIKNSKSQMFGR